MSFPKIAPYKVILNARNCPKLLEVYDEPNRVQDRDEHIIIGYPRQGELTQAIQVDKIKRAIATLGKQRNIIFWCYADYPDSSIPEDWGIVQTINEFLPHVEVWDEYMVQIYWLIVGLLIIASSIVTIWIATKTS